MNDITIFNHLGNDIRVMTDEQGEPLFVLKDICDALDLKNISDVASRLDEDGVGTTEVIDNLGRTQKTSVVTEAGLYEVIFMSRKPAAVLDITNVTQLRSRLSDDLCQTYPVPDRRGQVQQTWTVNEPGLYEVIFMSRKPEAKAFKRWVFEEVLPSIRKH